MIIITHNELFEKENVYIDRAVKYMMSKGYKQKEWLEIFNDIMIDIPNCKTNKWFWFPGVVRLYTENVNDANIIYALSDIMDYISINGSDYDSDFNGESFEEIASKDAYGSDDILYQDDKYRLMRMDEDRLINFLEDDNEASKTNAKGKLVFNHDDLISNFHGGNAYVCVKKGYENIGSRQKGFAVSVIYLFPNTMKGDISVYLRNGKMTSIKDLKKALKSLDPDAPDIINMINTDQKNNHKLDAVKYAEKLFDYFSPEDLGLKFKKYCNIGSIEIATMNDKKYGLFDTKTKKFVLKPIYRHISKMNIGRLDAYVVHSAKNKMGIYNAYRNEFVVPVEYDDIDKICPDFTYKFKKDGKWGLTHFSIDWGTDIKVKEMLPCEYDSIVADGKTAVLLKRNGKVGAIGVRFQYITWEIPCAYETIKFNEHTGRAICCYGGKYGLYNVETDEFVLPCEYDKITEKWVTEWRMSGYFVEKNGKVGLYKSYTRTHLCAVPCEYDKIGKSCCRGIIVYKDGKAGIYSGGNALCIYDDIKEEEGGDVYVYIDGKVGLYGWTHDKLVDEIMDYYNNLYFVKSNGKYAVVGTDGHVIYPYTNTEYSLDLRWDPYTHKRCSVRIINGKYYGLYSHDDDDAFTPCIYDNILDNGDDTISVFKNKKVGYLSASDLKTIIPCKFDEICKPLLYYNSNRWYQQIYAVANNGKWGAYVLGKFKVPCEFDKRPEITYNGADFLHLVKDGEDYVYYFNTDKIEKI